MITDKNIDAKSARYWCLFCTGGKMLNEATMTRLVNPGKDIERAYRDYDKMTDAQKSAADAIFKLRQDNGSRLKGELKYIANGMNKDDAGKVATQLIADFDAKGEKAPAMIARELGETFSTPEKIMPDGSALTTSHTDSNLVSAIAGTEELSTGKAKSWLGRTWDVIKGYWRSIADTVSEWFLGGKWEGASLSEKLSMLATGGIHALEIVAIAYLVYKIREWLFPQLKLAWKNLMSGKDLARCTFNDNSGNSYLCWFDKNEMKWQVKYDRGAKALLHKDDLFMPKDKADAFFATKFFDKFVKQCEKYISPYLDVQRSKQQLQNKDTPSDVKNMLKFIVDNADEIRDKMFKGSYQYFDEHEDS